MLNQVPQAGGGTPMIEQFIEIKAANPDALLFYRMGDFYELFFHDAEIAARALGITLTKRGKHQGEDIPMCGVPVHAADDYLQKLIGQGYRVAVCEQVEDPAEAKKRGSKSVVKRDVVRLVTPGTITEEKLLAPSEASYLMALGRVKGADELALAWIDISTGSFRVCRTNAKRLLTDILRVDPRELILADAAFHEPELRPTFDVIGRLANPQPAILFDSSAAAGRIARFYEIATPDSFGEFSRAELSAIAGAIAYVEKTQISERPPLSFPEREEEGTSLFIDAATRANLELLRTLSGNRDGSLLKAIDRTVTGGGARLLADRLMSPLTDPAAINARLDAISFLIAEPRLCEALRTVLKSAPDMPRALSRLALNRGGPRDMGALRSGLDAARQAADLLQSAMLPAELVEACEALSALPTTLASHLSLALAEELPLLKRDGGFVARSYDSELDQMRALRDDTRRVIAGMERDLVEETGIRALKIRHNNLLGYYIEVTAQNSDALTQGDGAKARFIHRQTMANAMRFTTSELAELESKIANAADRALQIELGIFDRLLGEIVGHADVLRKGAAALAALDVATSLAVLAEQENYARPQVDDGLAFAIEGGRHPVVEQALRRQIADPFVANDCDLSPANGEKRGAIWLLTGPNMGGKSTFLRQNALIAILAQMGSFVPVRQAHIGVVDRLFSRVGASDDLARGRSTFMVEMVETAAILNQAGERALVILDEIGRGTSTFDGLSIAWAAVEYLHEKNGCRAIFATHFHEMTALSEKLSRLANVTMKVKEWEGDVVFLHEVGKGAADRSYGVQVAKLAGLPDAVVARARAVLGQLEEGETSGKAAKLVDDLPLFSVAARRAEPKPGPSDGLAEELASIRPDDMTPREALEALYRLKERAAKRL
ncbi:DNA mismatch repair protein MutS [Mesorhizobium sp. YIM 152430]|uniref:DNA mismatch repair protein MutS n=1 Tax=Mesorhizobium sp. YIM 152430 TaxID=3031761 RepID=UPI0023DCEAAF|nr:DNA mismatch repair protein MutS [Mesorhizobium sp. YIM 152430]MDF1601085.1 DNA mismatch repair protein MutS [Mesorhizobium sp. YIM 152430]